MRKIFAGILLVLSLIVFGVSAFYIGNYLMQEKKTDHTYEILRDIIDNDEDEEQDSADLESEDEVIEIDEGLKKLHDENPDCIGWIHIEGTAIDYPVMYHPEEKEYYLHRNFYKEYDYDLAKFLDEDTQAGASVVTANPSVVLEEKEVEPTTPETEKPEEKEDEKPATGNAAGMLGILAVALCGIGAYYYFKIYKPRTEEDDSDDEGIEIPDDMDEDYEEEDFD